MSGGIGRRGLMAGAAAMLALAMAAPAAADTWISLGARRVQPRRDRDRFPVGADRGRFRRLRIAVSGAAVRVLRAAVTFDNGDTVVLAINAVIGPATDARSVDLPGDGRAIRHVDLIYRRVPGNGVAVVTLQGLRP